LNRSWRRGDRRVGEAYDASNVTFRVLRAYGWGPLLNLGWFGFRRPLTLLNLIGTPLAFSPRQRLPAAQLTLVHRALRLLEPAPGQAVLDVACGRGASSFVLANERPEIQVTGVDVLKASVDVASILYGNAPNLEYREGDAQELDLPDASFDRVFCLEAAFQFPDRRRFLAEARRVLRPGGRVAIVDFMADADVEPTWWDRDAAQVVRRTWQFERFDTMTEYQTNAVAAGFDVIEMRNWSAHVTDPLQSMFNLVAFLGRRAWGRRLLVRHNRMLRSLTEEDWDAFDRSARAHRAVRQRSRYVALVLSPTP
jgi:ubiquinone/menaquinone biosynthesis C-methylase UbiE